MAERREFEQRYAKLWRSIVNFLKNSTNIKISGIARAGSRRRGSHRNTSDLDIIFAVAGDPLKTTIYPELVDKLRQGFPRAVVTIGSSYNVINMKLEELDFDIVLLKKIEFEREVLGYKLERL